MGGQERKRSLGIPDMNALRQERAAKPIIIPGREGAVGIGAAMLNEDFRRAYLKLADLTLVEPLEGSTLTRFEREAMATWTSTLTRTVFCIDSHREHGIQAARNQGVIENPEKIMDAVIAGDLEKVPEKLRALLHVSTDIVLREEDTEKRQNHVADALQAGANSQDILLANAITNAFIMFNGLVEGIGAMTPNNPTAHIPRAIEIGRGRYSPQS